MNRKSYINYENFQFDEEHDWWIYPFDNKVVKIDSWIDLSSPPKPEGIQISVIIINWDRPLEMVESSIASVLNQDFPPENFEVILVDDASQRIPPKSACLNIIKKFPNHNFRAYLLERTRCYQDTHVYNVGLKRAIGWIVAILHTDAIFDDEVERALDSSYPKQPVLEGMWRHHNARDNLGLCPRMLYMPKPNQIAYWWSFPHPMGFSFRKNFVQDTHGFNEAKYSDGPVTDFRIKLSDLGMVFAEDLNMQVIHRDFMVPKNVYGPYPEVLRSMPENHILPDWPRSWGEITVEEEEKVIITNPLKETLKSLKSLG